jgi:hypothetical protein
MQLLRVLIIVLALIAASCAFAGGDRNQERHSNQHQHYYGG